MLGIWLGDFPKTFQLESMKLRRPSAHRAKVIKEFFQENAVPGKRVEATSKM